MAQFQIVVFGATGFVGKLVCEHITRSYQGKVNWAMAARNPDRLKMVQEEMIDIDERVKDVPMLIGDTNNQASVDNIVKQAKVVLACAGPFGKYGTPVVDACVRLSVHYCDITGEVAWVKRMADKYHDEAVRKGVKIVPCCGFDSIPSDMGTLLVVHHIKDKLHRDCASVEMLVGDMKGTVSGGTVASGVAAMQEAAEGRKAAADPYGLNPPGAPRGPDTADYWGVGYSRAAGTWTAPFIMQIVNTRVVRRSNALLNQWYGPEFSYTEKTASRSMLGAVGGALGMAVLGVVFFVPPLRALALRFLPKPGEGPTKDTQTTGFWSARVVGSTDQRPPQRVEARLAGKRDPGYFDTARMLLEAGLCLAFEEDKTPGPVQLPGGVLTPATAMGLPLIQRLNAAGISISLAPNSITAEE